MKSMLRRVLPVVAALLGIVLTVSLGNWQTRRADEKLQAQQAIAAAIALPPVELEKGLAAGAATLVGRRVSASGRFLDEFTVYIDNRAYRGQAGFHVLTPFVAESFAQPVLVLRGWVPQDPAKRSQLPALAPAVGKLHIEALVQRDLEQVLELASQQPPGPQDRLWQNASIDRMASWSGLTLAPVVLRQLTEQSSPAAVGESIAAGAVAGQAPASSTVLVRDWPSPGSGVDKHRAYAFQWYSMAVLIASLWVFLAWRARRFRA